MQKAAAAFSWQPLVKRAQEALPPRLRASYDKRNRYCGGWKRTAMGERRAALAASGDASCFCKFSMGALPSLYAAAAGEERMALEASNKPIIPCRSWMGCLLVF